MDILTLAKEKMNDLMYKLGYYYWVGSYTGTTDEMIECISAINKYSIYRLFQYDFPGIDHE